MQISTGSNIVAVNLKTESGDNYLILKDDICVPGEMVDHIRKILGTEFPHVWSIDIQIIGAMNTDAVRNAIRDAIDYIDDDFVDEDDPE